MPTGQPLIDEVNATALQPRELAFWWLGQLGYILKLGDKVVYIDAYLSPSQARTTPPLLEPSQVTNATLICGTHDHSDHIDRPSWPRMAEASPLAKFVVPALPLKKVAEKCKIPEDRFVGLDDAKRVEIAGLQITGVASAHEFLDQDPKTGQYPHLGYVIEGNGCRVYHSGDCCKYEGLETRLRQWPSFDVEFLPINGRDAARLKTNCIGNMTFQEAVDLAGMTGARMAVPSHWDMFKNNSEDPQKFVDYLSVKYPKVRSFVPRHGERVLWQAEGCPAGAPEMK
jgi:L-ascorbate metabolism protein UlaG (beta-lactamase superfamily)